MSADGKFDAEKVARFALRCGIETACPHRSREMCVASAIKRAYEAGRRAGIEEALEQMWCPPTCEDPLCDAQKLRALLNGGDDER